MKENRKIKKFISIYLAISVFCGSLNLPIFVFANEEEGLVDESISVSVDNEIVLPDSNIIDSATSTDVAVFLDISTTTSSVEILDNIETSSTTIEVVAPLIVTINDLSLNNIYLVSESSSTTYESAKEFSKLDISNSLKEKPKINKEELRDKKDKRKKKDYADGEILVKYKSDKINLRTSVGKGDSRNFGKLRSLRKKEDIEKENMSVLEIEDNKSVDDKIIEIQNDPDVEYAQPNYQYYPTEINTDDLDKDLLWGLDNTGQIVNGVEGTKDADISAPEAWSINTGTSSQVIVAIIDSGVSYDHPDLALNMWDGSACVGEDRNGISLNGGCNHGYDYEDNDKTPLPTTSSHGTHIAGIIAGVKNNNKGIVGVSPNAKIMAIKSSLTTSNIIKGINFAKQNGAKIINASWGSPINDRMLKSAISAFPGLFITAAGNDSANNENVHKYPSDYNLDNIISVTATDQNDNLASFSNYGITSVDVGAPGVNIYSTEGERVFDENFKETISPNIGNKFTQSGSNTWGTRDNGLNKTIVGDYEYWGNYRNNITSNLDSLILDLSGKSDSYLNFEISCDTEAGHDGVRLYFWDGASWILQDEYSGALHLIEEKRLSNFATNNFKYRFTWSSDQFNPVPYAGCSIDNIKIIDAGSSGESYQYMSGTSMATPYVSGLASLVWGTKPALSVSEVKNTILNTGDQNPFLLGKTASGRRINAFNALDSITPPLIQDIQVASTTATSTSIVWNTDLPSNSKVVYSTTSPAIFNTASSSALMIKHDLNLSGLSTSTTYYFYAESSDVYGNIATSSERFFTTLPYVESTTTPVVAEVGSVGSYGVSNSTSTAVVDIDRVAPIITVSSYNKLPTNRNIKVNAYVNEGTLNATSYIFTDNGSFDFIAIDLAGNVSTSTVTITNIDKTTPAITINPYITAQTDQDILVTATTSEGTLNTTSHLFTSNGSFNFTATDLAGNIATAIVTITNINKTATPVVTASASGGGGGGGGAPYIAPVAPVAQIVAVVQQIVATSSSEVTLLNIPSKIILPEQVSAVVVPKVNLIQQANFNFINNIGLGSRGDDVINLQKKLSAEGFYSGPITGFFGNLSAEAIKKYQEKNGITPSGYVGLMTRFKLNSVNNLAQISTPAEISTTTIKTTEQARRELIASLQKTLVALLIRANALK